MGGDLLSIVLDRADQDESLSEAAKLLVMAALEGDDVLAAELDRPVSRTQQDPTPAADAAPPIRAFLSAIRVDGFRGIGTRAALDLLPGPGLTVVAGRNGCGKSSFAEALEVALTSGSYRWKARRSAVWSESWRNLHQADPSAIEVDLTEEGRGITTVGATWATGAGLADLTSWVQRRGGKREPSLDSLGWVTDLELFRPFLSYDELGALFAEPSKLYEALSPILGLERLDDALTHLTRAGKDLSVAKTAAGKRLKDVKPRLSGLDDERATRALDLLTPRRPDLDAVQALVTGTAVADDSGILSVLHQLAGIRLPEDTRLSTATDAYRAAQADQARLTESAAAAAGRRADLLSLALDVHAETGDGPCPVCATGTVDGDWATRVREELAEDRAAAEERARSRREYDQAARALTDLVSTPPAVLSRAGDTGVADAADGTRAVWQRWAGLTTPDAVAEHGRTILIELTRSLAVLQQQVEKDQQDRQDAWQPLAVELGAWLDDARTAAAAQPRLDEVTAAGTWLKDHAQELRNERIRPLADEARSIWSQLRQESNVDLEGVRLAGTNTRRRVELAGSVDGNEAGVLSVMSQGELNALALSLFLPKATSPDSPFGFVVIDDPVQAMDPSKIDGLARVLHAAALDRQVVVLTHDDRLPEAVRRLELPARIIEVTRGAGSHVTLTAVRDPAESNLDDARAVASDRNLDDGIRRRVIPELCRLAMEARCRDLYFRRQLRTGLDRVAVETAWSAATTTRQRLELVVAAEPRRSLDQWLGGQRHRQAALGICTSAVHSGLRNDPHHAIDDVRRALNDLDAHRGR